MVCCEVCGKETSNKRFCSVKCKHSYQKSETGRNQARQRATGVKFTKERRRNISKGKTDILTEDEKSAIVKIWELGYISTPSIVMQKAGINKKRTRVYRRFLDENRSIFDKYVTQFNPVWFQNLSKLEHDNFVYELSNVTTRFFMKKWGLSENAARRFLRNYNLSWIDKTPEGETWIEKEIRLCLERNNLDYCPEFNLTGFRYDFRVGRVLIEAQGDYWHCNPIVYEKPISNVQIRNLQRDRVKYKIAKENNYDILYVWEFDLSHNKDKTLKWMLQEIELLQQSWN